MRRQGTTMHGRAKLNGRPRVRLVILQPAGEGHNPLQPGLFFLRVDSRLFLGFLARGLAGRPCFEFARDTLEIIWHFRACLQEEELQVSRFILQLDLRAVLEDVRDGTVGTKQ